MTTGKKVALGVVVVLVLAEQAWLLAPLVKRQLFPPHTERAAAGREVAERLGCFSCHGAEGTGGPRNPGSDNRVVPALAGGEMMMWADDPEDLREWILYGKRLDDAAHDFERSGYSAGQGSGRAIVMPAYEPHLAGGELELLLDYLRAISGLQFPADKSTEKGLTLAYELGCFRCHGPMGTGGVANPGSLKGYVPGFVGEDYAELVSDRSELVQWLRNGISDRFRDNPAARAVLGRQAIKMPAYEQFLDDAEIESLVALVEWLSAGEWKQAPVP